MASRLFVKLLADALNEMAYPAELAGLAYVVHNNLSGFTVVVSGYSHKLPVLLDAVLDRVVATCGGGGATGGATGGGGGVAADRFAVVKEEVLREYKNMK